MFVFLKTGNILNKPFLALVLAHLLQIIPFLCPTQINLFYPIKKKSLLWVPRRPQCALKRLLQFGCEMFPQGWVLNGHKWSPDVICI